MFCFHCGHVLPREALFCPRCGIKQAMDDARLLATRSSNKKDDKLIKPSFFKFQPNVPTAQYGQTAIAATLLGILFIGSLIGVTLTLVGVLSGMAWVFRKLRIRLVGNDNPLAPIYKTSFVICIILLFGLGSEYVFLKFNEPHNLLKTLPTVGKAPVLSSIPSTAPTCAILRVPRTGGWEDKYIDCADGRPAPEKGWLY